MPPENSEQARWFAEEVEPHEPPLRAWLRFRFPKIYDVDDIVQECFIRVLRAREVGQINCAKAFMFVTARNIALNVLRHDRYEQSGLCEEASSSVVLDTSAGIPESIAHSEELEVLIQAIQSLPDRCRQVVTLRKLYGLSQKEVAAQLRISTHTVEAQSIIGLRKCVTFFRNKGFCTSPRS